VLAETLGRATRRTKQELEAEEEREWEALRAFTPEEVAGRQREEEAWAALVEAVTEVIERE